MKRQMPPLGRTRLGFSLQGEPFWAQLAPLCHPSLRRASLKEGFYRPTHEAAFSLSLFAQTNPCFYLIHDIMLINRLKLF